MKFGFVSREYPPLTHIGGIATYSAAAARLLAEHGHEVHVVCNGPKTEVLPPEHRGAGAITVHRVGMLTHHFPEGRLFYPWRAAYRRHLPHYLDALTWARTAARYVEAALDFRSFDAWEWPETMGEGALLPEAGPDGPATVCRIHTGWLDEYADNAAERRLLLSLQRRACRKAARVVSPSAHMAGGYARNILRAGKPVAVNRNPIRLWEEPVDWSVKRMDHVLYVGRVEWRKGLQVLLQALEGMGSAADGLRVRVVGARHPPDRESDRDCQAVFDACLAARGPAPKAGVTGWTLEYAGPVPHDGMRKHYDWAGMLVIPSLMENHPYSALEGLSRGCYLLGSRVGGLPEIIDRPSRGRLFPAGDSAFLGRIMGECRQREFLGRGDGSYPKVLEGNVEEMRAELGPEACYRRLLEAYGPDFGERDAPRRVPRR